MKQKIYRVFDDEWEAIYGKNQLIHFACEQIKEHEDDYIEENGAFENIDEKDVENYKSLVDFCLKSALPFVDSVKFCKWALSVRHYEIEELIVY